MNKSFSLLEFANIIAKITKPRRKIHKREEHADDEKDKLLESQRQMNSLSQDGSKLKVCGTVNSDEEEHSRILSMKHFPSDEKRRTAEIMGRGASRCATFGFSVCSLSLKYSKPVLHAQRPHALWLAIIGMLSFTLCACAASVMLLVGARFTHMQITVMLIAFFALLLA